MTSVFNAVAAPFVGAWQLFHRVCMPFMFIMLLADPTGFLMHMAHAATLMPDAISNVASVFSAKASAATTLTHAHGAAAAMPPMPTGAESFCPTGGGVFEDYKQVFDCASADSQQSMLAYAQRTGRPLMDAVANICSSGTVVTNKMWDYTPIG